VCLRHGIQRFTDTHPDAHPNGVTDRDHVGSNHVNAGSDHEHSRANYDAGAYPYARAEERQRNDIGQHPCGEEYADADPHVDSNQPTGSHQHADGIPNVGASH
jgi:hypothetical protein